MGEFDEATMLTVYPAEGGQVTGIYDSTRGDQICVVELGCDGSRAIWCGPKSTALNRSQ